MNEGNIVIATLLLEAGKVVIDLLSRIGPARREQRVRIATLLNAVSETAHAIADSARSGQEVPWDRCVELGRYADALGGAIKAAFIETETDELVDLLHRGTQARQMLGEISGADEGRSEYLRVLDEAAGTFRAAATLLSVK